MTAHLVYFPKCIKSITSVILRVSYYHHYQLQACIALDGSEIEGNKITCCRAQKKAERAMELKNKFEAQKIERISRYQGKLMLICSK